MTKEKKSGFREPYSACLYRAADLGGVAEGGKSQIESGQFGRSCGGLQVKLNQGNLGRVAEGCRLAGGDTRRLGASSVL